MATAEIVDLTTLARGFPKVVGPEIGRDFILDTIDKVFEGRVDALLLDGEEGIGKTVLLSQFAKRHYKNTISLFIKPASRAAIDPGYIAYVLAEQVYWMLNEQTLPTAKETVSDSDLLSYFSALERRLFRRKALCFVVVDGLEEASVLSQQVAQLTLSDLLPFGLPSFRYLISGSVEQLGRKLHKSLVVRPFSSPYCSLDDAVRYLDGLALSKPDVEELYKLSRKIFGRLATVRRLLQSGTPPSQLLDEAPPDFLELEWEAIGSGTPILQEIVAIVAFAQGSYDLQTISEITKFSIPSIEQEVRRSGFLVHDSTTHEITFCSDGHRRFAQRRLTKHRDRILDILISFHLGATRQIGDLSPLPEYFHQARRHRDLLNFLDTRYFLGIAENTQSLTAIQQGTNFGFEASINLEDLGGTTRFATQAALLRSLATGETTRSEIEARIQLGDKALAIGLAQRASLKENRLELLAVTAAALKTAHGEKDEALLGQISALVDQVDFSSLGDRATGIAADLATVDPDIAYRVIQLSNKGDASTDSLDRAFANLAMRSLSLGNAREAKTTADKGRSHAKNPQMQRFLTSISLFLGSAPAAEIIQHAESFGQERGLVFLRQWATITDAYKEAGTVLEFALDTLLKTTSRAPQIRDFRELATPLPFIQPNSTLPKLIQRFDSQRATVLDLGTNEDLVRLQLRLAQSEATFDIEKAHRRFFDVYWQTSELRDLSTKASCLSWMVSNYSLVDRDGSLEKREGTLTVLRQDLAACIQQLLESTAEHFDVAQGALRAFSRTSIPNALGIADNLNTANRRDDAYRQIVQTACQPTLSTALAASDFENLIRTVNRIEDFSTRDSAISMLVNAFCGSEQDFGNDFPRFANSLCDLSDSTTYGSLRAEVLAAMYNCIRAKDKAATKELESKTLLRIDAAWMSIETSWRKAQVAFRIAKNLGKNDSATAKQYIQRGEQVTSSTNIVSENQFAQYALLVKLSIRAFTGLLPNRLEDSISIGSVERSINAIPSNGERAKLWGELACRSHLLGRKDFCTEIVAKYVRPLYDLISKENTGAQWSTLQDIAPALFVAHQASCLDRISKLPRMVQGDIAHQIIFFLLRKTPLDDAFVERPVSAVRLKQEDVLDIFSLFRFIDTDSTLYFTVRNIVDYVLSKRGRYDFAKQNLADIADRIDQQVLPKLPDKSNIKHDGYVITTRAQSYRLRSASLEQWNQLAVLAEKIPNTADRAYVLLAIAGGMVHRFTPRANELFRAAKEMIDGIPAAIDRIDRWNVMAEEILEVNQAMAKECIKSAYDAACFSSTEESFLECRRELLDLAHSIDAEFASTLISKLDDDPARSTIRRDAKRQLRTLELERSITSEDAMSEKDNEDKAELSKAAWRGLGLLNAGWTEPLHMDQLRRFIPPCTKRTLEDAYPILAWIIENLVRRTGTTPAARTIFSNIFMSLAQTTETAVSIIGGTGGRGRLDVATLTPNPEIDTQISVVISPGERDRAVAFLSNWVSEYADDYIKICDPYFGTDDLELLRVIKGINRKLKITVLTSKSVQEKGVDLAETYMSNWKNHVSPHLPGNCEVVVVGTVDKGELPIHDRWWITKGSGVRLGTSFNSLGLSKTSDISLLQKREAFEREQEIDELLLRTKREHNGSALGFMAIAL